MSISIRRVQGDELDRYWLPLVTYAFQESPPINVDEFREKYRQYVALRQVLVLFEGERPLATANTIDMTQAVRGKVFTMGGVAGVATQPNARRKGYARQLVSALFKYMYDHEQAFTTLYPFRESFYGRLGYVGFPQERIVQVQPQNLQHALRVKVEGSVDYHHIRDALADYQQLLKDLQPHMHGMALFPDEIAEGRMINQDFWVAFAYQHDEIVGAMLYKMKGFNQPMLVPKFYYKNPAGKYLLLHWLARHVDQVATVVLELPTDALIETWIYDEIAQIQSRRVADYFSSPTPMGRILAVEYMSGLQTGFGSFSARIHDEQCEWNNGVFSFDGSSGELVVSRSMDADCELSIQGLSALVYGVNDPADFAYRGWGNPDPELQVTMQRMFPTAFPWMHADF